MIRDKNNLSFAMLFLGVSFYGLVQAHDNSNRSNFTEESQLGIFQTAYNAVEIEGRAIDHDQCYLSSLPYPKKEIKNYFKPLGQPKQNHMVTKNISFRDVERATYMSNIAYEGYEADPTQRHKINALFQDHIRNVPHDNGYSEAEIAKQAQSRVHFFGTTKDKNIKGAQGAKDGCVIEDVDGKIYVAYRGTMGLNVFSGKEWFNNYKFFQRTSELMPHLKDQNGDDVYFHRGFINRVENTFNEVTKIIEKIADDRRQDVKDLEITVTGHSKGAGIAQIAALKFSLHYNTKNIKTILLAPPRAVNKAGVNLYNEHLDKENTVLVMQNYDAVTAGVAGFVGYKHLTDHNRLYLPCMNMMHVISDYEAGLNFIKTMLDNNLVLKDDMGNVYTGKGEKGLGNPLLRGLWNMGTRLKNLFTWQRSINYTAMPVGSNDLSFQFDMSKIEKDLSRGYSFLKFSTSPYYQTNITTQQLESTSKVTDFFDVETKAASDQSWRIWLQSKIWQ